MSPSAPLTAASLFSGGGIGDLALRAAGTTLLAASELRADRAAVLARNFPEARVFEGDIDATKHAFVEEVERRLDGRRLDVLFATPPCQGMSKNGRGKLLNGARKGARPKLDPRNRLVLHALDVARALSPRLILFENVPEMQNTIIEDRHGQLRDILDVVTEELGPAYQGTWRVVEFADYGVPQRRQRLITVFSRDPGITARLRAGEPVFPEPTHAATPTAGRRRWVSVLDALAGVPPLDAADKATATSEIPFHRVPLLDADKYFWVSNTPPGEGAFDNQCVAPGCGFDGNTRHSARRSRDGINRASTETPLHCARCGALLPRPWVREGDGHRLMKGYTSAYRRMRGDLPANALTRNLSYACSDSKIHPEQHRVLSLHEAFIIHTIADYAYRWERADGRKLSDKTVREIVGESIPPRGLEVLLRHLLGLLDRVDDTAAHPAPQLGLPFAGDAAPAP